MNRLFGSLCLFLLCSSLVSAQGAGSVIIKIEAGITDRISVDDHRFSDTVYSYEISRAENGDKTFTFKAKKCIYATLVLLDVVDLINPVCTTLTQSDASRLSPIEDALAYFDNLAPTARHFIVYTEQAKSARPDAILTPKLPVDPQLIFFDGPTYEFVKYDLATSKVLTSVTLAPQARKFAVRPGSVNANEVWVGHGGLINQISIVDLAAGKVLATIPTPSLDPNNSDPSGLVFTNSGATALYTSKFFQADAANNRGALVLFDPATRRVVSTQLLKIAPEAILMAPDGLTAYLMGGNTITYYDVLSGTSDLTAPFTYISGSVFIHPDGTRIFVDQGTQVAVFDLSTRKMTQIRYNFPNNALAASVKMSQEGLTIQATDGKGNVVVLGTRYGDVISTYQTAPTTTTIFPAPVQ